MARNTDLSFLLPRFIRKSLTCKAPDKFEGFIEQLSFPTQCLSKLIQLKVHGEKFQVIFFFAVF